MSYQEGHSIYFDAFLIIPTKTQCQQGHMAVGGGYAYIHNTSVFQNFTAQLDMSVSRPFCEAAKIEILIY